jgi:hypothetical protein
LFQLGDDALHRLNSFHIRLRGQGDIVRPAPLIEFGDAQLLGGVASKMAASLARHYRFQRQHVQRSAAYQLQSLARQIAHGPHFRRKDVAELQQAQPEQVYQVARIVFVARSEGSACAVFATQGRTLH